MRVVIDTNVLMSALVGVGLSNFRDPVDAAAQPALFE